MAGIGETLRAARRQQRRRLSDAAAETRIRETYLGALEAEDFPALGGDVYVKGFLRNYAKYLGLDPDPLLDQYRQEHEVTDEPAMSLSPSSQPALPAPGRGPPQLLFVAGGIVAVLLILIAIGLRAGNDEQPVAATSPPQATPSGSPLLALPLDTASPAATATASPTAAPLEALEVAVSVDGGPSWMRVTIDGQVQLEGERPEGFQASYSAEQTVLLRIGDASRVRVAINGEDQGTLGDEEQVINLECEVGADCAITEVT